MKQQNVAPAAMRLHKAIAQAGITSRRKAEVLISQGLVQVNGQKITALGTLIDPSTDVITVEGRRLRLQAPLRYVLLHKPRGYITTCHDDQHRPTVLQLFKHHRVRLFPVGRLDINSEGVLLLTNDGRLAHRLLHPRYGIPRTYLVHVSSVVAEHDLEHLRQGVMLEDGKTAPTQVVMTRQSGKSCWLRFTLREGKPRQIHRMLQRCGGYTIKRLQRIAMGPLTLAGLLVGEVRELDSAEVVRLYRACHLEPPQLET